ncbi:tetratricopeptide repeat protein [Simplicispira psychrophila]|uniref:tetratricopeptide repeat protein n=1 Tax=Simplicispira psychrophila TaxID=80882 RepID=UPI0004831D2A|nr:tetratricopeptide repeat protein [Simplicispira psychrophila]
MTKPSLSLLIFGLVVTAAVLGIYLPGWNNQLLFDDQRLLDGSVFGVYGHLTEFKQRMLSYGSFVWIDALFGPDWGKQRLVNILLHLGTVAALYALLRELLARTRFPEEFEAQPHFGLSRTAALRVGVALFAVNPVAVYAVAYLMQRSILMATFFAVLACWLYVRGLTRGHAYWYGLALLSYVLAVLSKEHAFLMAAMALPLYIFIRRPPWKKMLVTAGVSLAVVGIASAVLWSIYASFFGTAFDARSQEFIRQLEILSPGISGRMYPLSILNEAWLFFAYGVLWFLPNVDWMSIDLRPAFPLSLTSFPHILGAIGYVALWAASVWFFLRGRGALSFAALCLLFPLLLFFTEFATVWVQDPMVLYRSYLWAIAVPGLIAVVLTGFAPRTIYVLGAILMLLWSVLALERTLSLRDGFTAWGDAAEKIDIKAPPNAVGRWQAFLNLGGYHVEFGSRTEARKALTTAIALGENNGYALFNMGLAAQYEKKHAEALAWFTRSEAKGFHMALLPYHQGESLFALGQWAQAYQSLSKALTMPVAAQDHAKYRTLRAEAALAVQQYEVAIADFQRLLLDAPTDSRLLQGLGLAQVGKGNAPAALAIFNPLIAKSPSATAYYGRAMAYLKAGDPAASLQDLDQAIALEPSNPRYKEIRAQIAAGKEPR